MYPPLRARQSVNPIPLWSRLSSLSAFTAILLCGLSLCWARPQTVTVEETEGDVSLTLTLEETYILDDINIPCTIEMTILGENRELTAGDTIEVKLLEDDVPFTMIGDDTIWTMEETVSAEEASAQRVERVYDCGFEAINDWVGGLEMYAAVEVDKETCGGFTCESIGGEDTPSTSNIGLSQIEDDLAEEDDELSAAFLTPRLGVVDRIARDPDWFKVTYTNPVDLQVRLISNFDGGALNITLYDMSGSPLHEGVLNERETEMVISPDSPLLAGEYFLQVVTAVDGDYNFYDLQMTESTIMTTCAPMMTEERPCGLCGREVKTCNAQGEWDDWSDCETEGVCDPGSNEVRNCGAGGNQERSCQMDCQWGEFTSCVQCEDGATETCYSGPEETRAIGACTEGMRTCNRGSWSSCTGDVWPGVEACGDGLDNDCDGQMDGADPECVAQLGAQCDPQLACAPPYTCLTENFPDGYCGSEGCEGCQGVCAQVLGAQRCLKGCQSLFECRSGYLCLPVGLAGEQACAPPCTTNEQCGVDEICSEMDSICVAKNGMTGGTMGSMNDAPMAINTSADEGCVQSGRSSKERALWIFFALFFAGLWRRSAA
jgi:hypothetical protein